MTKTALINAKEVAEILGTFKSHAYKVVQQLNEELRNQGYIVIAGYENNRTHAGKMIKLTLVKSEKLS